MDVSFAPINPLASSMAAASQTQEQQSIDRARKLRRESNQTRVVSADQVTLDRQVESASAVDETHPDSKQDQGRPQQQPKKHEDDQDKPHIDLTA